MRLPKPDLEHKAGVSDQNAVRATRVSCKLRTRTWLTPSVMELVLEPSRAVHYTAGQFLAVELPGCVKRAFSLSRSPTRAKNEGLVLCMRYHAGGVASEHFKALALGSTVTIFAPYGDFAVDTRSLWAEESRNDRALCFISTGTGIAPLLAMAQDLSDRHLLPAQTLNVFGCQNREELLYVEKFRELGITSIFALTRETQFDGIAVGRDQTFDGRITDFMKALPYEWPWHSTDYYLCGNPDMVISARQHLVGRAVPLASIHSEIFLPPAKGGREVTESAIFYAPTQKKKKNAA